MNLLRFSKIIGLIGLILIILSLLIFLFVPSKDTIIKNLEMRNLPTPIFADRETLLDIMNKN